MARANLWAWPSESEADQRFGQRQDPSPLLVSAETGSGLEALKAALFEQALPHGRSSAELLIAANHLGEITGAITSEEILGEIFSRFCLGK